MFVLGRISRQWLREAFRFGLVNLGCFVLDVVALLALRELTALPLAVDAALAFAVAALVNFALSRQWVFERAARGGRPHADLARYALLVAAGLLITTVTVPLLAGVGVDYRVAKLIASGMVGVSNFVVMPRWVFLGDRQPRTSVADGG
jgi:putative flippase GtrA